MMKFIGENKPCDEAIVWLQDTIMEGDNNTIHAENAIDMRTWELLPPRKMNGVQCSITPIESEKLKEWYFNKVKELNK